MFQCAWVMSRADLWWYKFMKHLSLIGILLGTMSAAGWAAVAQDPTQTQETQEKKETTESSGQPAWIEEMLVSANRSIHAGLGDSGSRSILSEAEVALIGATHVNETLARVPGVWVSRGSGQEHLAAIRSGVFTGSGACGEFIYLENGVPIRPAGFCNINNLFEVNTEQASAIEVWRGPASALLGGNALHGAINVLTPTRTERGISIEGGPYDFYRVQAWGGVDLDQHTLSASLVGTSSNGYRDDTGYGQQKLNLSHATEWRGWSVENYLSIRN